MDAETKLPLEDIRVKHTREAMGLLIVDWDMLKTDARGVVVLKRVGIFDKIEINPPDRYEFVPGTSTPRGLWNGGRRAVLIDSVFPNVTYLDTGRPEGPFAPAVKAKEEDGALVIPVIKSPS